jgi:hypothetical protein
VGLEKAMRGVSTLVTGLDCAVPAGSTEPLANELSLYHTKEPALKVIQPKRIEGSGQNYAASLMQSLQEMVSIPNSPCPRSTHHVEADPGVPEVEVQLRLLLHSHKRQVCTGGQ